jgi:L-alanine-DL-glutamate epimerase-like enolase superfamily enzyme
MSTIAKALFRRVRRPMKTLFATSLGHKSVATSVLVDVILADGVAGRGEVPTSFVMPHETADAIAAVLRAVRTDLLGAPIDDYPQLLASLRQRHEAFHMTLAGLETALMRAWLARHGTSERAYFGTVLQRFQTDITIPLLPRREDLADWIARATRVGFGVYKVKVSGQVQRDIRFIQDVRLLLSEKMEHFTLRLDGNQGYTAKTYLDMVRRLEAEKIDVEVFEQPLAKDDYQGLRRIRRRGSIPVILDETVFSLADCRRVIDDDLADGINIKIAKSGLSQAAEILKAARSAGLKLMIGCMTETMVGLSAGIHLAAGTGAFDYVDLDSIHLMHHARRYGDIGIEGKEYVIDVV